MAIDDNTSYELTGYQVKDLASKIRAKADSNSLASVATSGLYSDLTGAPTIPTVYNGTLTIQQNGTTLGTFSANQDTNETINITGGGGSSVTTFYWAQPSGASEFSLYKDYQYTQIATPTDVNTAIRDGALVIRDNEGLPLSDNVYYHAVSWDDDEGFLSALSSDMSTSSPVRIGFFYNSSSNKWERSSVELQEKLTAGSNITIAADGKTISATDTTYTHFTGATSSTDGTQGLVPGPLAGDEEKVLHGDGTWKDTTAKLVEMSYGEANAWTKFINAYNAGSIVYCRASSNANPATGSQTRKAFMAYVNNATSPTSVEFQYVRSVSSKTDSQPVDQVFVYTLTNTNGGTWSVASRNMAPKIAAGTGINVSYSNGTYTISLA